MNGLKSWVSLTKLPEFDDHKLVAFNYDKNTGLRSYIAIHRSNNKNPSFGATRYWKYSSESEALKDALRLSKTMSYKAAVAGLPGGGAKAVIIADKDTEKSKKNLFKEYARRVNNLSGKFVTGADVGLTREDVITMRRISPFFVGSKVSPERFTALGIFYCVKECLKHVYGNTDMNVRSFAVQGLGKIGTEFLKLIYPHAKEIFAADIDGTRVKFVKTKYPNVKIVPVEEIHEKKVNIFSPCALSNCINFQNVNELNCEIILGGANNQLEDNKLSDILQKMGILYAPDYVVNAGGLISVYDEYENGSSKVERVINKVRRIERNFGEILRESKHRKVSPLRIANEKAEKVYNSL